MLVRGRCERNTDVVAGACFSAAAFFRYGVSLQTLTMIAIYGILTAIAWMDWKTQVIPPLLNGMLGILGVISYVTMPGPSIAERLIGCACISVPMLLLAVYASGGFGGGDIKMMAAAGLLLGWEEVLTAFLIGLIPAGIYGLYLLFAKKKSGKASFALGPFLSLGIAIALL